MPTQLLSVASGEARSSLVTVAAGDEISFVLTKGVSARWPKKARANIELIGSNSAPTVIDTLTPQRPGITVPAQKEACTYKVLRPADAGAVGVDRIGGSV